MTKHVDSVNLIRMEKEGAQLDVHPTTVEAHKVVGWKVVEGKSVKPLPEEKDEPLPEEEFEPAPKK